jgi:hypothetical protein
LKLSSSTASMAHFRRPSPFVADFVAKLIEDSVAQ